MSKVRFWPPEPPQKPLWRGVGEDIQGRSGDPLFGLYLRGSNFLVEDGGTIRKRRGMERAVDQLFLGGSKAALAEAEGGRVMVIVDSEGISTTSGIIPPAFDRIDAFHSGFPNDSFDRADSATLATTGKFWSEGDDSEAVSGRTAGDGFQIKSNGLWGNHGLITPTAEWDVEAPTPWYAVRVDIDLSSALAGAAVGDSMRVKFCMGLPPAVFDANQVETVPRMRMTDAISAESITKGGNATDVVWSGCYVFLQMRKATSSSYTLTLRMVGFASSEGQDSLAARVGAAGYLQEKTISGLSASDALGQWALEFGRKRRGAGKWREQAAVWKGKSVANIIQGTQGPPSARVQEVGLYPNKAASLNTGLVYALPPEGRGGFFGIGASHAISAGTSAVTLGRISTSLRFYDG